MRIQLAATIRNYDKKNLPKDILAGIIIMADRKSTRLNSSHITRSRMPSSA